VEGYCEHGNEPSGFMSETINEFKTGLISKFCKDFLLLSPTKKK
jgi:hypothetical protein